MKLLDLGTRSYEEVWKLQKDLVWRRINNEISDTLILVEHPAVITKGRRSESTEIVDPQEPQFPVFEVERGGKVTYHGPGQLVGYPIIDLGSRHRRIKEYLRNLEEVLIKVLADYQIWARRRERATGVWVGPRGEKKIASLGVAVKRWVTYHGFALNVNTDLKAFDAIQPCGFESAVMTSMKEVGGREYVMSGVKERISFHFREFFRYEKMDRCFGISTESESLQRDS